MSQIDAKLALFKATESTLQAFAGYTSAWKLYTDSRFPPRSPLAKGLLDEVYGALVAWGNAWELRARGVTALGLNDPGERDAALNDGAQFLEQVVKGYQRLNEQAGAHGLPRYQPGTEAFRELQHLLSKLDPSRAREVARIFTKEGLPTSGFGLDRSSSPSLSSDAPNVAPRSLDPRSTGDSTFPSMASARVLDAAIASHVVKDVATELDVLVRLPESPGLEGVLQADDTADARPEDVKSKAFKMTFPVGRDGRPGPRSATVAIEAPGFRPTKQEKTFVIPPNADSEVLNFLMTPSRTGRLPVLVELHWEEAVRGQRTLRTECVAEGVERPTTAVRNLVQLPIEVARAAGETTTSPTAPRDTGNANTTEKPGVRTGSSGPAMPRAEPASTSDAHPKTLDRRVTSNVARGIGAAIVVGALGIAFKIGAPTATKPDPLTQCFQAVLTKTTTTDSDAALKVGKSLAKLVAADSDSGAFTLTTANHSTAESRAISDETVRVGLQQCVQAYVPGGTSGTPTLPELQVTATVRVQSPSGRPLSDASVQLANDGRQACTTGESGACDLTLVHLKNSSQSLRFVAVAKHRPRQEKTATVEQFLGGLDFQMSNYPSLTIYVTQKGDLVRDKGSVTLDAGAEFPAWSLDCHERNVDDDCYTQRIDSQGRAIFYYARPFEHLSISTVVEGHTRPTSKLVLDPKNLPASFSIDLARSGTGSKLRPAPLQPTDCTVRLGGQRLGKCSMWCGAAPGNIPESQGSEVPATDADCRKLATALCRQHGRPICTYRFESP